MKILIALLILLLTSPASAKTLRVITLSPALTEILYALHFQNLLVGVSDFSNFPEDAKKLPSVGPYTQPNFEKIVDLKPDLVFVPLEGPEDVKHHLDQLHFKYAVIKMRKLKEIGEAARKVAEILKDPTEGVNFQSAWDKKLKELLSQPVKKIKSVFIEVQKDPLIAAGSETFLDEIVTGCGGKNIVKEKGYPRLTLEFTAATDIDMVFLADYFQNLKEQDEVKKWWVNKPRPPKRVETLDSDTTARPGPRLVEGIKYICAKLREEK